MNQQDPPAGLGYPPPPTQYPTQGYPPFYGYPPVPEPPKKKRGRKIVLRVVMTLVTLFAAFCAFALIVAAFSNAPAPTRPVPTQQAPAPQTVPTQAPVIPAPTVPPTSAPTVPEDTSSSWGSSRFDQYVVLESGHHVIAKAPESFSPSATAAGNTGVRAFSTEITVRNGTAQPLNPSMISVSASVNGQQAESVYDSAQDIGMPTTTVLPGRSVTYVAVFSSPVDHGAVQVDVSPGFSNGTASFEGSTL